MRRCARHAARRCPAGASEARVESAMFPDTRDLFWDSFMTEVPAVDFASDKPVMEGHHEFWDSF